MRGYQYIDPMERSGNARYFMDDVARAAIAAGDTGKRAPIPLYRRLDSVMEEFRDVVEVDLQAQFARRLRIAAREYRDHFPSFVESLHERFGEMGPEESALDVLTDTYENFF